MYLIKSSLKSALYAYDGVQQLIGETLLTTNPLDCVNLLKQLRKNHEIFETDSKYFLQPYRNELNLSKSLDKAVKIYKSRFEMLNKSGNLSVFVDLLNKVSKACKLRFDNMEPIKRQLDVNSYTFDPIHCSIGVKLGDDAKTVLDFVIVDNDAKSLTPTYDIVVDMEIFTNWWEYGKLGGWRDMHRLIEKVMVEYFKVLFPEEPVGDVKQVRLMMV